MAWATPSVGGGGGAHTFARNTATIGTTDESSYTTVSDMNLAVSANRTYAIEGVVIFDNSNDNHNTDVQISFPSGTATVVMYRTDGNSNYYGVDQTSPISLTDVETNDNPRVYRISGVVYVGGTGGNLQFLFRRNNDGSGGDQSRIVSGSYWSIAE
jgi:hypothetical protein